MRVASRLENAYLGATMLKVLQAFFLILLVGATADTRATAPAKPRLRILVPQSTATLPFWLMAAEQMIPGVELEPVIFLNHPQALALLLRGEADVLFTGTSQGWENRLGGSPVVMVTTGVWGLSSLIVRDPSIRDLTFLKGKRLALPFPGAPLDFQTRAILTRAKIDPDRDCTLSYGPFMQSLPKLLAGQLDAVALPEPMATIAVRTHGLRRATTYADAWARVSGGEHRSPQVSLFVTELSARNRRDQLLALVEAWRVASLRVQESPAEMAKRFAERLAVDPAVLEASIRYTVLSVPTPAENRSRVLAYYREVSPYFPGDRRPLDRAFFFGDQ